MNGNGSSARSPAAPSIVTRAIGGDEIVDRLACNLAVLLQHHEYSTTVSTVPH